MSEAEVPGGGRDGEREANSTLCWFLLLAVLAGLLVTAVGFMVTR